GVSTAIGLDGTSPAASGSCPAPHREPPAATPWTPTGGSIPSRRPARCCPQPRLNTATGAGKTSPVQSGAPDPLGEFGPSSTFNHSSLDGSGLVCAPVQTRRQFCDGRSSSGYWADS